MGAAEQTRVENTARICNRRGLHARAAAKFVRTADTFKQTCASLSVRVSKDGMDVCGSSIMGLLMLSASLNTQISISVTADDAQAAKAALDALCALVERRFDEAA